MNMDDAPEKTDGQMWTSAAHKTSVSTYNWAHAMRPYHLKKQSKRFGQDRVL
jgi:hypothetical protein